MINQTLIGKLPTNSLLELLTLFQSEDSDGRDFTRRLTSEIKQVQRGLAEKFDKSAANVVMYCKRNISGGYGTYDSSSKPESHLNYNIFGSNITSDLLTDAINVYEYFEVLPADSKKKAMESGMGKVIYSAAQQILDECEPEQVIKGIQMHRNSKGVSSLEDFAMCGGSIDDLRGQLARVNPIYRIAYEGSQAGGLTACVEQGQLEHLETEMIARRMGNNLFF